jgi:hypothetical protein
VLAPTFGLRACRAARAHSSPSPVHREIKVVASRQMADRSSHVAIVPRRRRYALSWPLRAPLSDEFADHLSPSPGIYRRTVSTNDRGPLDYGHAMTADPDEGLVAAAVAALHAEFRPHHRRAARAG